MWSALAGALSTFWLYLACLLYHEKVPALNNVYSFISRPSDTNHIEIALFVGVSLSLLCYFLQGWTACSLEGSGSQPSFSAGKESSLSIVHIVPSRPGEIGKSLKDLALTVFALGGIVYGLDLYRSQAMDSKWIKLTGVVESVKHSTDCDKYGRHYYITVETRYGHTDRNYINSLYF